MLEREGAAVALSTGHLAPQLQVVWHELALSSSRHGTLMSLRVCSLDVGP